MERITKLLVLSLLVALATTPAMAQLGGNAFAGYTETFTEPARTPFDGAQLRAKRAELATTLAAERVAAADRAPLVAEVTAHDIARVERAPDHGRIRVGVAATVAKAIDFAGVDGTTLATRSATPMPIGALRGTDDGFVWTAVVRSPGAEAMRVHFASFFLPAGAELFVYSADGEAFGPYRKAGPMRSGEFWTNSVMGSELNLQIHYRGDRAEWALSKIHFTIADVGHMTSKFQAALAMRPAAEGAGAELATRAFCSFNANCVENAACQNVGPAAAAEDAVAHILFRSGGFYYICTGGLIADTDPSSQVALFLTANHCVSKGREANSLETFFHYTVSCGQSCESPGASNTVGATILAANRTSDYTLLELAQQPPSSVAYMGYSSAPIAFSNGASLYRISHPGGAPQAYSEHDVDTGAGTCGSWPRGNWIYSRDVVGATEGGSSGSPVLNGSGQVVGQLSGACGTNVNDNCDAENNATVDGALAAYFDDVAQWLDPGPGSCTDSDGDGYCAESGDCDDGNFFVNPGEAEVCDDGIDNDCDGNVDSADSDCDSGGSCVGDPCVENADCCTNKCTGKPGAKTCK